MKYLLLIPGGLAVAMGNPQDRSRFFPLGVFPWRQLLVNALCLSQYFTCLGGLLFCLLTGFILHSLNLDLLIYLFAFWHLSTAAVGTSEERRVMHSLLGAALGITLNSSNLVPFLYTSSGLVLLSSLLFRWAPKGKSPAFTKTKGNTGFLPWLCLLGSAEQLPVATAFMLLVILLTIFSSVGLSRSMNSSKSPEWNQVS
jgi:hypothetical protein